MTLESMDDLVFEGGDVFAIPEPVPAPIQFRLENPHRDVIRALAAALRVDPRDFPF